MEYQIYVYSHLFALLATMLVLAAWLRNPLVSLINRFMGLWASILAPCKQGLEGCIAGLQRAFATLRGEMAYSSEHTRSAVVGASTFWDIITPPALIPLLLVLVAADVVFSDLRFAALLGTRPHLLDTGLPVAVLASALFVCLGVVFGLALFDVLGATPSMRPWVNFSEANRKRLTWFTGAGFTLTCLTAVAAWTWGALQQYDLVPAVFNVGLPIVLWTLLGILLVSATLLICWIMVVGWASFAVIVVGAMIVISLAVRLLVIVLICSLGAAALVLVGLLDAIAHPATTIWNWGMQFGWAKRLRLGPIVPVDPSPIEVTDIDSIVRPEKAGVWSSPLHVRVRSLAGQQSHNGRVSMTDVADT